MSFRGRGRKFMVSSRTAQTNLATAVAVDSLIRVSGDPGNIEVATLNDLDLIGGTEEPTEEEVDVRFYEAPFAQTKVKPHTLAFVLAASSMDHTHSTPAGAATARLHTFTPKAIDDLDFDIFTVEELYATGAQRKHIGCVMASFELEGSRRTFFSLSGRILGCGKVATGAASVSEVASEKSFHTRDAVVFLGTSWGGTAPTQAKGTSTLAGSSVITTRVERLRWGHDTGIDQDFGYHFNSGMTWGRVERGDRKQQLEMSLLFSDLTEAQAAEAQTVKAVEMKCISTVAIGADAYFYGFVVIWPKVQWKAKIRGAAGDYVLVDVTCDPVLEDTVRGSVRAWVWNSVQDYLQ